MRPKDLIPALNLCLGSKRAVMLWGPPGVGKSDLIAQLAASRNEELRDVRLATIDQTDLRGLPVVTRPEPIPPARGKVAKAPKPQVTWAPPDFLPTEGKGILFLDELVSAAPSVQAVAYQLILNRRVGDYVMPDGWGIIAAGNRAGDRSLVHTMPSALSNRFVHLDYTIHNDDWHEWADTHKLNTFVTGFLRFRPALLHAHDPSKNERAFPTPRSWAFVSDLVGNSHELSSGTFELVKGCVGEGAATEFQGYLAVYRDLPTAAEILKDPTKVKVPSRPDGQYAVSSMLLEHTTAKTVKAVMDYINRLPVEFHVFFLRSVLSRNRSLCNDPAVQKWLRENSKLVLN